MARLLHHAYGMGARASPFCVLPGKEEAMKQEKNLWQKTRMELLRDLACSDAGLTAAEAGKRLA